MAMEFIQRMNFIWTNVFCILCKTFWICCTTTSLQASLGTMSSNSTPSISKILEHYDVRLRPNFGADPLYVGIEIQLAEINAFSEVNMDYTITIFLNQYWKDERLAFSTGDESLTFTGDFAKRIWVPDIFFPADKDSFIHDVTQTNQMVELSGDGSILYGMRFTTRESCQMDLRNFPLDSQNCTVEIESYGYTVRDVVMYWKDNPVSGVEAIRLPQLRIGRYETNDRIEKLATGIYQRLQLSLKFERNFGYFFFQMYLPAILIVMLSWVSFWISNDATAARVALGITTVLTMTTINNSVRNSLPRISYAAIDVYLVSCFLFVFAALIEYATVNYIFWEQKERRKRKLEMKRLGGGKRKRKGIRICFRNKPKRGFSSILKSTWIRRKKAQGIKIKRSSDVIVPRKEKCSIEDDERSDDGNKQKPAPRMRSHSFSGAINLDRAIIGRHLSIRKGPLAQTKVRFMQSFRKKSETKKPETRILDVSSVDNYSRVGFPVCFLLFNTIYWTVYSNKA